MPRGRPRRNKKPKTGLINTNGGIEDIVTESSETEAHAGDVEENAECPSAEDEEDRPELESETERPTQRRKLTEGKIDVDEDLESDDDSDETDAVDVKKDGSFENLEKMLEKAADECRLTPKILMPEESALFPFLEVSGPHVRSSFLVARNSACLLWTEDPTVQVTTDRLVGFLVSSCPPQYIRTMYYAGLTAPLPQEAETCDWTVLPPNWNPWLTVAARHNLQRLSYLTVLFLERFGYINFGKFKVSTLPLTKAVTDQFPVSKDKSSRPIGTFTSPPGTPLKVIICGAGAAGLIAARQLTYFGAKVTVLEARDRIGGRVWTLKKGDQSADLGAMIITGMIGNPSTFLANQGGLELESISQWCNLYAPNGRPVSKDKDERMEEEFNRLLATAAHLGSSQSPIDPAFSNTSLGGLIDDLIRYQENHILPLKSTHKKLVTLLLDRKATILDQMAEVRKLIEGAYTAWQNSGKCEEKAVKKSEGEEEGEEHKSVEGVLKNQDVFEEACAERRKRPRVSLEVETTSDDIPGQTMSAVSPAKRGRPPRRSNSSTSQQASDTANEPLSINAYAEFEKRRLMSDLHQAWKQFDPLQCTLSKINRQLDVLSQNPPRDVYLTNSERNLVDWHLANLEFANATELKNLSLFHWDQDDAFELHGCHAIVRGGFGKLMDVLTSSPCGQIEFKSSVKSINVTEKGVTVESLNAAISEDDVLSYSGDAVLCALPLGVLKASVAEGSNAASLPNASAPRFNPPLPAWKVGAIERLGFGVLNKVVLFFDRFFWDRSQRFFGSVHDSTDRRGELFLFWSITDSPCLIGLVAGKAAVALESHLNDQNGPPTSNNCTGPQTIKEPIVGRAMKALRKIFSREYNGQIPEPVDAYITRWSADPESLGSYSYVAVGATGDDYDLLAAPLQPDPPRPSACLPPASVSSDKQQSSPVSRVYFAGEHTCRFYPASVHGAMFSGMREVARMANALFPGDTPVMEHGFTLTQPPMVESIPLV